MSAGAEGVGGLPGWWATQVPGWVWNLRPGPYQGPAAGYGEALGLAGSELVFLRHRVGLGAGACRFASRVVVPFATAAAFPGVQANPYRRLRDLDAELSAGGCRPSLTTRAQRAVLGEDLARLFGVEQGSTCHRVTITLHHPRTRVPLALGDHLSGWTTPTPRRRTSRTVTTAKDATWASGSRHR